MSLSSPTHLKDTLQTRLQREQRPNYKHAAQPSASQWQQLTAINTEEMNIGRHAAVTLCQCSVVAMEY